MNGLMFFGVAAFLFFPMAMSVNDQQGKNDQSANQHHNDDGLVLPEIPHEAGEIIRHTGLIYTGSHHCQAAW